MKYLVFTLWVISCVRGVSAEDTIRLKSGEQLTGTIKADNGTTIILFTSDGDRTIERTDIYRIEFLDARRLRSSGMIFVETLSGPGVVVSPAFENLGNPAIGNLSFLNYFSPNPARAQIAMLEILDTNKPRAYSRNVVFRTGYGLGETITVGLMVTSTWVRINGYRGAIDDPLLRSYINFPLNPFVRVDAPNLLDYAFLVRNKQTFRASGTGGVDLKVHTAKGPFTPYLDIGLFNRGASASLGARYVFGAGVYFTAEGFTEEIATFVPARDLRGKSSRYIDNNGCRFGVGLVVDSGR
jgi:hypothetical protein